MEFILKLKPKFNCLYSILNIKRKIEKDSFETLKIDIQENENFVINIEPITKNDKLLLPYNIYIKNDNFKLNIESPNIEVLDYKNVYILSINMLEAVKDMKVLLSEQNFSVFNTYCTNITTKSGTTKLPCLFNNVSSEKQYNYQILTFFDKRNYVVVLKNDEILFADFYNEINTNNKVIEILTDIDDIAKHSVITKIDGDIATKTTVYKYQAPKLTSSSKIIPIAFLQALKVNNIKLCKHYLSGNLKDIASLDSLKSFFGDYKKFELDNDNVVLFYQGQEKFTHKIFTFKINENKIYNIDVI